MTIETEFSEKCKLHQYENFKTDWIEKYKSLFPEIIIEEKFLERILGLQHDLFENIYVGFYKLERALEICDYLEKQSQESYQDNETIRIAIFVSLGESIYKIVKPEEKLSENLIKGFFKTVENKLNNKGQDNLRVI